jgi:glycosyltransferase involved in cell wall biosynthesis
MSDLKLSIIIPLLDEAGNLELLHQRLTGAMAALNLTYEILFVDDGSTDDSPVILERLHEADSHVKVLQFRRNFGKTAALSAGFSHARGEMLITMDADLQDDPAEIGAMLEKLEEGNDLVAAWRVERQDGIDKTWPSRFFNLVVAKVTGLPLHDFNCGFKAYRHQVTESLKLYGELHRFVPVLAHQHGFRVTELPVRHHPRHAGASKYGAKRLIKGFLDFATVLFLTNYLKRPLHLFGLGGLAVFGIGFTINLYLAFLWMLREFGGVAGIAPIGTRPLLSVGILTLILGIQIISVGLLGEMVRFFSFRPQDEYTLKRFLE